MTLTDQQVIDMVNEILTRERVRPEDRIPYLRQNGAAFPALKPLLGRYLAIKDPPRQCQVEHDHWEGKIICGNMLPCRTHGGG